MKASPSQSNNNWHDPVKDKLPRKETLKVRGNLKEMRELLRRVVRKQDQHAPSSSHGPDASR
jgi:hypothetical protein